MLCISYVDAIAAAIHLIDEFETFADRISTTRVSFFMNRFRKLGFIDYNGTLPVHSSLLNVVLHE